MVRHHVLPQDVLHAALHRAVHRLGMVRIIMLWSGWMKFFIALLVIGLLEQNVGSDSCILQLAVILNGCCRNIDINAADRAVFMLDTINGIDAL